MKHPLSASVCATLCLVLAAPACMVHPVTLEQEFNIVSEQKELAIGHAAHPQIVEQFGFYHDRRLQDYVAGVGQKLVSVCRRRDITYRFTVLDSDMVNAFAVPGGYIYITRGLMAYLNSEAELAGVLGHEIGHVVGRDSAALISQGMIAQLATLAGVAGSAVSSSDSGADAALATNQLFNALMLGFSREREYLADEQSVEYMARAGYDPTRIISFMQTLSYQGQGPTGPEQYLVTHPFIFDRIARVEAKCKVMDTMESTMGQLGGNPRQAPPHLKVRSEEYKHYLDGLAFGPRERLQHIKLYTVRPGDTFAQIARRTGGSAVKARLLSELNGMPVTAQLIAGATLKVLY